MTGTPVVTPTDDEREFRDACRAQWIADVARAFADLPRQGTKLAIHTNGDVFPSWDRYTTYKANDGGAQNHFQGCARLLRRPYFAVSGGDWRQQSSHLFIARLTSRGDRARWGSNLGDAGPPEQDRAIHREDLDEEMWHAGGIDVCGHLLAVPVECGGKAPGAHPKKKCPAERSRILLFDVRAPAAPARIDNHIDRPTQKATAVALAHVPGRGYLVAVLSGAGKDKIHHDKQIEFYESNEDRIGSPFTLRHSYHVPRVVKFDDYQSINFAYQSSGSEQETGDTRSRGDLYLLGLARSSVVDLFWVKYPGLNAPPDGQASLEFLARREFDADKRFAEFKAGACVHMTDGKLRLYAVPQWRLGDGRLQMMEWSA